MRDSLDARFAETDRPVRAMTFLDLTLLAPEENLAADEILLIDSEGGRCPPVIRFWEPATYFVVVGYTNSCAREVNLKRCREEGVPVLRRISGGGTVLQGPGCLNYALVLPLSGHPEFETISSTTAAVMQRNRQAVESVAYQPIDWQGHSDLTIQDRKFSGNAQRRRRGSFLFHGTFLIDFDLRQTARFLHAPMREPAYRDGRSHGDFLTNLNVGRDELRGALRRAWGAHRSHAGISKAEVARLVQRRYRDPSWKLSV